MLHDSPADRDGLGRSIGNHPFRRLHHAQQTMTATRRFSSRAAANPRDRAPARGSVLIVTMLLSAVIGVSLVSYLKLTTKTLQLSHRTFFADNASNLAETG